MIVSKRSTEPSYTYSHAGTYSIGVEEHHAKHLMDMLTRQDQVCYVICADYGNDYSVVWISHSHMGWVWVPYTVAEGKWPEIWDTFVAHARMGQQ